MINEYFILKKIDSRKDLKHGTILVEYSDICECPVENLMQADINHNYKFNFSEDTYLHKTCKVGNPKKYFCEGFINSGVNSGEYVRVTSNGVTWNIPYSKIEQKFYIYRTVNLNPKYKNSNAQYLIRRNDGTLGCESLKYNGDAISNFGEISPSPTINFPGGPYAHGTSSPGHFEKPIDIQVNHRVLPLEQIWMETPIILNNINLNSNQNEVSRLSQAISGGEEIQGHTIRGRVKEATITSRPVEHRTIFAK